MDKGVSFPWGSWDFLRWVGVGFVGLWLWLWFWTWGLVWMATQLRIWWWICLDSLRLSLGSMLGILMWMSNLGGVCFTILLRQRLILTRNLSLCGSMEVCNAFAYICSCSIMLLLLLVLAHHIGCYFLK